MLYVAVSKRLQVSSTRCDNCRICHRPYNLYCVGADVKPCSITQSTVEFAVKQFHLLVNWKFL